MTIYLDNHATTRLDPHVFEAMIPVMTEHFGNASSRFHEIGLKAGEMLEEAREKVSSMLGCQPSEVIFTSGATESNNMAIAGVAHALREKGRHVVTVTTEHHAVIDPCKRLQEEGFEVTYLPVDREGHIDLDRLRDELRDDTILCSIMAGNNENGALHPVEEIGAITREKGVLFHCDAVQVAGKLPIDVDRWQVDLLSLSGHKFHGPKGVGALYVRRRRPRARLEPLLVGGGQEFGLRSGTYNTPGIVGLAKACEISVATMEERTVRMRRLRDRLWDRFQQTIPELHLNGPQDFERRLPNNLNIEFRHCEAQSILMGAGAEVACSPGSACTSDNTEPSFVLLAMGLTREEAISSLRFGLSHLNTEEEIDRVPAIFAEKVAALREMSPVWKAKQN